MGRYEYDRPARILGARGGARRVRLAVARSPWRRFLGLMGLAGAPDGCGLLLEACGSIHMMFMRFPIDVVWLGRPEASGARTVVGVSRNVRPWRVAFGPRGARSCIEMAAGTAPEHPCAVEME